MRATEAKIAVYGAGATGTVLGALLTLGGLENVELVTRNEAHVRALQTQGASVECLADKKTLRVPVKATLPKDMGAYDVVFLMTKQRKNAEILESILPHLSEGAIVCTTQNGLPEQSVASIVGTERTYGAATTFGADFLGEGKVRLTSKLSAMQMQIGGYENDEDKLALLREILSYAGKAVGREDFVKTGDLRSARWSKLTVNAAFSGLSVATGLTFGEVAKKRKTRKIALGILRECLAVAHAAGGSLSDEQGRKLETYFGGNTAIKGFVAYLLLPFAMRKHKKLRSGMLADVLAGRKCEIDFIDGAVVAEGKRVGVATPLCARLVEIVHGVENGLYEIDYKNTDFFEV